MKAPSLAAAALLLLVPCSALLRGENDHRTLIPSTDGKPPMVSVSGTEKARIDAAIHTENEQCDNTNGEHHAFNEIGSPTRVPHDPSKPEDRDADHSCFCRFSNPTGGGSSNTEAQKIADAIGGLGGCWKQVQKDEAGRTAQLKCSHNGDCPSGWCYTDGFWGKAGAASLRAAKGATAVAGVGLVGIGAAADSFIHVLDYFFDVNDNQYHGMPIAENAWDNVVKNQDFLGAGPGVCSGRMSLAAYEPCRKNKQCDSGTCTENGMGTSNGYCKPLKGKTGAPNNNTRGDLAPWNVKGTPANRKNKAPESPQEALCSEGKQLKEDGADKGQYARMYQTCIVNRDKDNFCWRSAICQ